MLIGPHRHNNRKSQGNTGRGYPCKDPIRYSGFFIVVVFAWLVCWDKITLLGVWLLVGLVVGICLVTWVTWGGGGWWQSGCPSPVWGDLGFAPLPTPHSLRNRALVTHILTYHRITTLPFWPKIHIWRELSFNMLALPAKRILDPSQNLPFLPLCCYCCCSTKITPRPKSATQIKPDIVFPM